MSTTPWQQILTNPSVGQHIVQTYQDERFLVEAVSRFAGIGLKNDQGVLLIATRSHLQAFIQQLSDQGIDVQGAEKAGRLMQVAVEDILPKVMAGELPVPENFNRLIETAIKKVQAKTGTSGIRIYGELVNVLWLAGNLKGAMAIEALWDELGKTHPFTLFCGYKMDSFDQSAPSNPFQEVCEAHSHVIPAEHYERLEHAVIQGSREILGESLALLVRGFAATGFVPSVEMPVAQKTLMWLRQNMPVTADKISSRSRGYYGQPLETVRA